MSLRKDWPARLYRNKGWLLRASTVAVILAPLLLIETLLNVVADAADWMKWKWTLSPTLERLSERLSKWAGKPEVPDGRG